MYHHGLLLSMYQFAIFLHLPAFCEIKVSTSICQNHGLFDNLVQCLPLTVFRNDMSITQIVAKTASHWVVV